MIGRGDFREDWFMKQWYSEEELNKLWDWCQKSGFNVYIKCCDERWSAFHIEDYDMEIGLAGQRTEEDCVNWMGRMGFDVVPITEIRKMKLNKIIK